MSIGLPTIDITFIQKAITAIQRSERGVACIVIKDGTLGEASVKTYKYATDIESTNYTADNLADIKRCFLTAVNKVIVVSVAEGDEVTFANVANMLENIDYNYICAVPSEWQQELANYVVNRNAKVAGKKVVAVVANVTVADSKYVINVKNSTVHDKDTNSNLSMIRYLPRLTAILANLPMNRSITYYELEDLDNVDLSFVTVENTIDEVIDEGYLVLINDEGKIKVGRGVNSLTTFTSTDTEDMRKIIIVESMNIILHDIFSTFKEEYIGKYKNSYDNQCLLISAINTYFRQLAREEILDPNFENIAYVDVELQREAWLGIGKTEAEDWTEAEVKNMTFKSFVYLAGQVKILDAIEDLKFTITMA